MPTPRSLDEVAALRAHAAARRNYDAALLRARMERPNVSDEALDALARAADDVERAEQLLAVASRRIGRAA